jgi:hypothetical protein
MFLRAILCMSGFASSGTGNIRKIDITAKKFPQIGVM